jgi:putative Holliday junction resolvase
MGRLLCIDYGRKRCGVAATDALRIVASPVATVPAADLLQFILDYVGREKVDAVIIGKPVTLRGLPSESWRYIEPFAARLRRALPPQIEIRFYDERFTSTLAHQAMIDGGLGRKARQDKALVDRTAATIILNDYLQSRYNI